MQSWGDLIVLLLPAEVSCSALCRRWLRSQMLKLRGFCILIIYFGPPSDHQTHAAANLTVRTRVTDDGPGPLCTLTLTLNFVAFRGKKNTKKTDVFYFLWENLVQGSTDTVDLPSPMPRLVYKEELGLQSNGSPRSRNSWPRDDELRGENYWPLRWIVTFVWGAAGCSAGWLDCWHPWPMATFV